MRILLLLAIALTAATAGAHPLAPSLLEIRELGGGRAEVRWKTPLLRPTGADLRPVLPAHCRGDGAGRVEPSEGSATYAWTVHCGARGLVDEEIEVEGLAESRTAVLVRAELADGRVVRGLLDSASARLRIPARGIVPGVAWRYLTLGIDHLARGLDHLLFVLGLVLLAAGWRPLLATVTAFTIGHSVTLSAAALGFVRVPTRPVELAIAATILFVAVEIARRREGAIAAGRLHPGAVAFVFGLLHGLGFAGALADVGLPAGDIPLALLSFNAGIEIGQLAAVALFVAAASLWRRVEWRAPGWTGWVPAYAIGSMAAFWCFERAAQLF